MSVSGTDPYSRGAGAATDATLRVAVASGSSGPTGADYTDRSGTIATGALSQVVAAANSSRRHLSFQNVSDTVMWINDTAVANADQPSIKITPGSYYEPFCPPLGRISVICATAGKAFVCKEG